MSDHLDESDEVEEEFPGVTKQVDAITQPATTGTNITAGITPPADVLELDNVLAYTQQVRLGVIKTLNKALAVEVNSEYINGILKASSDMDKAVVSRRRVGIEEEAAKTSEQQQRDSAAILRAISAKTFQIDPSEMASNRPAPKLDDSVPPPELVPDQTTIGAQQLSYDQFAKDQLPPT